MTTRKTAPPARLTFAEIRERISRPRRIVTLTLDAAAAAQVDALEELCERLRATGAEPEQLATAAAALREAEQCAEASRAEVVLESVSHRTYQELRAQHPATREQIEDAKRRGVPEPAFDADAFSASLVFAQLIEPRPGNREAFDGFWAELSDGQLGRLWDGALAVQLTT
ncbi:hypothetical protein AB0O91_21000 [Kitasatospora sp. NPDC089797]|uniref:hypothetical protein n=1 Tax=Kitasatospora sp. NPDC089797 TaxID=3155298 RepID=UPI00342926C7